MEKRRRNLTALGLLVLSATVLFVWGGFYLVGNPFWRGGLDVSLILEDGAGLKRGDRVNLSGVQVGSVREVQLRGKDEVVVTVRLNTGLILPADTRAALRTDVFGANTLNLLPGTAMVRLERGDTIRGVASPAITELMLTLGGQARSVLAQADSLLSPKTVAGMHATAEVLPQSAEAIRTAFLEFSLAAAALRRSAEGLEGAEAGPALARTMQELEGSARAFTSAAQAMEASLGSMAAVMQKIERGEGTLGLLVNDSTLYSELSTTLREVRQLTVDVREQPRRYFNISVF